MASGCLILNDTAVDSAVNHRRWWYLHIHVFVSNFSYMLHVARAPASDLLHNAAWKLRELLALEDVPFPESKSILQSWGTSEEDEH
jgi:hypothetical protein